MVLFTEILLPQGWKVLSWRRGNKGFLTIDNFISKPSLEEREISILSQQITPPFDHIVTVNLSLDFTKSTIHLTLGRHPGPQSGTATIDQPFIIRAPSNCPS
ncbi:hypothetical protein CEXT_718001 [Caerostris extrusa]|uniref:Uncharacterized protein n=1 Tax=Caerostris extrusa TaxID=172846 RepID=A0AAV4VGU9_CAEEX|nr:hypothetical protein CEXT_718001 [Caerostris extrusa]